MRSLLAGGLIPILLITGAAPPTAAQDQAPAKLNIEILDGDGAINNIRQRTAREPIVQVTDENHKPVAGALVLFTSPDSGPGGLFNGAKTLSVTTDAEGKAVGRGFQPNAQRGKYQIQVDASYRGVSARRKISQSSAVPLLSLAAKILIVVGIAAGAAVAGVVASNSGGGNKGPSPTVITAGPPSVGGPR